jgi:signal peptidase I
MTLIQWFIFFLAVQVIHYLATWKLYQKAGRKSWEAAVPVYNAIILMKIINRPTWWTILLFVPVINLIMIPVVWVETIRSFGKNTTTDTILVLVTLGFYIFYINYTQDVAYIPNRSLHSTTQAGDTVSSLLFAIVVATIVHTYVMQPFTIPTSSLEKSLLVGDFLFVSKFHYGARTPMTTVAAPMVHDTLPLVNVKSYSKWPQLPYFRIPGLQSIERNDIVVFNWPVDTVYKFFDRSGRKAVDKPIDKKSNYVKRCVGIPGDNLSIKDGAIYINNELLILPERAKTQFHYTVVLKEPAYGAILEENKFNEYLPYYTISASIWDKPEVRAYLTNGKNTAQLSEVTRDSTMVVVQGIINQDDYTKLGMNYSQTAGEINMTEEVKNKIAADPRVLSVTKVVHPKDKSVFPQNSAWSIDNFGPITIPEQGKSVSLTAENLPLYKRVIEEYENNELKINGNQILINGTPTTSYTFKQNYYWMMGDNRHRSEDSRYWGFVPADHIVGKPVLIWMSLDQSVPWSKAIDKIRWERLFTTVGGDGQPYSYFKFFLIALAAYFGISFYMKKKKQKTA